MPDWKLYFHDRVDSKHTYVNDEEVEPAPGIGEVLDKAVCHPLQQHFQDEDVSEDLVCVLQNCFDGPPLLNVDVLKCLNRVELLIVAPTRNSAVWIMYICKSMNMN